MQLGKFADHLGQQIGLAELRRALGLGDIGADDRRKMARQRNDARDALGLGAELLVEHDVLELRQPVFQPRLQIGLVEELRIRQPRADHALVAGDDRLAAVGRLDVRDQNEFVGELRRFRIAHHKAFLVVADGGADDLFGDGEERLVERAHQHHRPFDQARDLGQQALVLDQFEALREGQGLGVGQDHLRAARRIDHDLGGVELRHVVVEPLHLDRLRAPGSGGRRWCRRLRCRRRRTARRRAPRSRARTSRRWNAAAAPS